MKPPMHADRRGHGDGRSSPRATPPPPASRLFPQGGGPAARLVAGAVGRAGPAGNIVLDCALDEVLVRKGESAARVWAPRARAAVIGAGSSAGAELHLDRCRADGVRVVRRISGGSAVLLTPGVACVSLVIPHASASTPSGPSRPRSISDAFRIASSLVARALESLGVATEFRPPGDLAAGPRKLVGLAQARRRKATLVHGVVPVDLDPDDLERYLAHPPKEPEYREGRRHRDFVTTLAREYASAGGRHGLTMADVLEALASALSAEGVEAESPRADELAEAARLVDEKYAMDEWTFRR